MFHPGDTLDRYKLLEPLGQGGQASVWKASDLLTGDTRAVKLIDVRGANEEALERMRREARALAQLDHPSLCKCFGMFEDVRRAVLGVAIEFVHGTSLDALAREGSLSERHREHVLRHVAAALEHIHERGIVHRDLKPRNIIVANAFSESLDEASTVRIIDLGIAVVPRDERLTTPGHVIGTAAYMAPEQIEPTHYGAHAPTPATDTFAFALVAWRLWARSHPTGLGDGALLGDYAAAYRRARNDAAWPPRMGSASLDSIVAKCLVIDPARRAPSAREIVRAIAGGAFLEQPSLVVTERAAPREPVPVERTVPIAPRLRSADTHARAGAPRRGRTVVALAGAAAVGALLLAVVLGQEQVGSSTGRASSAPPPSAHPDVDEPSAKPSSAETNARPPDPSITTRIVAPICGSPTAPLKDLSGKVLRKLEPGTEVVLGPPSVLPDDARVYVSLVGVPALSGWLHADLLRVERPAGARTGRPCPTCGEREAFCQQTCAPHQWAGRYEMVESCFPLAAATQRVLVVQAIAGSSPPRFNARFDNRASQVAISSNCTKTLRVYDDERAKIPLFSLELDARGGLSTAWGTFRPQCPVLRGFARVP